MQIITVILPVLVFSEEKRQITENSMFQVKQSSICSPDEIERTSSMHRLALQFARERLH